MSGVVAAACAASLLVAVILGLRFVYGYRVEGRRIDFVVFRVLPVYHLPVDQIEFVRKASWDEFGVDLRTIRLGNRLSRECVLIQKRKGWFHRLVVTPTNPDDFIEQVVASQRLGVESLRNENPC